MIPPEQAGAALASALPRIAFRGVVAGALMLLANYPAALGAALVARALLHPEDAPMLLIVAGILVAGHAGWRVRVYTYAGGRPLAAWLGSPPGA